MGADEKLRLLRKCIGLAVSDLSALHGTQADARALARYALATEVGMWIPIWAFAFHYQHDGDIIDLTERTLGISIGGIGGKTIGINCANRRPLLDQIKVNAKPSRLLDVAWEPPDGIPPYGNPVIAMDDIETSVAYEAAPPWQVMRHYSRIAEISIMGHYGNGKSSDRGPRAPFAHVGPRPMR
jgi:hypothetical protein